MPEITLLGVLQFVGGAIALASTIWGIRHKPLVEKDGRVQLTREGRIAIAFAIGGTLLGGASAGVEALANQQKAAVQAMIDLRNEQRQKRILDETTLNRQEARRRDAEERAIRAEERAAALERAKEERDRDLALARTVNIRSAENLGRTQATLTQVQRSLYPIRDVQLTIHWEIPGHTPGLAAATRPLAERARREGTMFITVEPNLYPGSDGSGAALVTMVRGARVQVGFHRRGSGLRPLNPRNDPARGADPDLMFILKQEGAITYNAFDGSVTFITSFGGAAGASPTGRIVSISDLEEASLLLNYYGQVPDDALGLVETIRPIEGLLGASGRGYSLGGRDSRFQPDPLGRFTWRLARLPQAN